MPIGFETSARMDLEALRDPAGFRLVEFAMPVRWKDYDGSESLPAWAAQFDLRNWGVVSAWEGETVIGGTLIAMDTLSVDMLERRRDLAVVWDLRVAPKWRGRGVGRALFEGAIGWARERRCIELRVETQDINVAACRFYARQGCVPLGVKAGAYRGTDDAMVLWTLPLG